MRLVGSTVVVLAALAGGAAYAVNIAKNREAAAHLAMVCDAVRAAPSARKGPVPGADALGATFQADFDAEGRALCAFLHEELAWYRWNWGRAVAAPRDPERHARMAAAYADAQARCAAVVRASAEGEDLGEGRVAARIAIGCGRFVAQAEDHARPPATWPVWDWPMVLAPPLPPG